MFAEISNSVARRHTDIIIRDAHEHNLKNISLAFPRGKLVVVTGPSGSGKTSLVFDVLYHEALRRMLWGGIGRRSFESKAKVASITGLSFAIGFREEQFRISSKVTIAESLGIYGDLKEIYYYLGAVLCSNCHNPTKLKRRGEVLRELTKIPQNASITFLAPIILSSTSLSSIAAQGFSIFRFQESNFEIKKIEGILAEIDETKVEENRELFVVVDSFTVNENSYARIVEDLEMAVCLGEGRYRVEVERLKGEEKQIFSYFEKPFCEDCQLQFESFSLSDLVISLESNALINKAKHASLKKITVSGVDFQELFSKSIESTLTFANSLSDVVHKDSLPYAKVKGLIEKLEIATQIGLGYLSLSRTLQSLSFGELQRVSIVRELQKKLEGVLYLLDEPCKGLHPCDVSPLVLLLRKILEGGSSVIAIEHDSEFIAGSDYVIALGDGGGRNGGGLSYCGSKENFKLFKPKLLSDRSLRKEVGGALKASRLSLHNLAIDDLSIPLGTLTVIVGVSGSGKSSLLVNTLNPALKSLLKHKVLTEEQKQEFGIRELKIEGDLSRVIDVSFLSSRSSRRATVATSLGIFHQMRNLFAKTIPARINGFTPKSFAINSPLGWCEDCKGRGEISGEQCLVCEGTGIGHPGQIISFKSRSLVQWMKLTIDEIAEEFVAIPKILERCEVAISLGLGYLSIGQRIYSLSHGERERIALIKKFRRTNLGTSLYVFDEPTRGLGVSETELLLKLLLDLRAKGNTIVVVEHSPFFIKNSDYVIELGPGAGAKGGRLLACGTPEEVKMNSNSLISKFL